MRDVVGNIIKKIAIILFVLEVIGCLIGVITLFSMLSQPVTVYGEVIQNGILDGSDFILGIIVFFIGVAIAFVSNIMIYGFGVLIENTGELRNIYAHFQRQNSLLHDISEDTQFLCNQSIRTENTLVSLHEKVEAQRVNRQYEKPKASGTNIEWTCPHCNMKNPIKARFCMNCGKEV